MSDLLRLAQILDSPSEPLVLVTLVSVTGSSYRKPGARMLITPQNRFGLISGGCLEAEIAKRCQGILAGRIDRLDLSLDTRKYLGCDGRLKLVCERIEWSFFEQLKELLVSREESFCLTYLAGKEEGTHLADAPSESAFTEKLSPLNRLLVFGNGPDTAPLMTMARTSGWMVTRVEVASDAKRSGDNHGHLLPDASSIKSLKIDDRTACVVMNHHFGRDLELLLALWDSPTNYLGLLGSKKRRDQLMEQLLFGRVGDPIDPNRRYLYAPVGMKLGADGPQEIALEICAQILQVFSSGTKS